MVIITRSQLGCILLVLLSISSLHPQVLGARRRYLAVVENIGEDSVGGSEEIPPSKDFQGVFASSERAVPSGSDPQF